MAEIKEISEDMSKEENFYQHFGFGKRRSTLPHQEFKYCDLDVHEDLYQLLKYYIPLNSSPEIFEKAMKIWTTFVEPMFNAPPRPDASKTSNLVTLVMKSEGKNIHKENGSHITKVEKEEGELSPNGDFEEDNFAAFKDNEADRTSCDSENVFENGEVSGSETADVENHSHEEHNEVHNNKAESEGEAEKRLKVTVKPLTKYVPGLSHNNLNDPKVFYGNDTFYVLFRLHQVRLTVL